MFPSVRLVLEWFSDVPKTNISRSLGTIAQLGHLRLTLEGIKQFFVAVEREQPLGYKTVFLSELSFTFCVL